MGNSRALRALATCVALGLLTIAHDTRASKGPWEEYDQLIRSAQNITAFGPTLFGDQVNLQNGTLSFSVTDVSLKGNNALPVAFTRTFTTKTSGGAMKGTLPGGNIQDGALADWEIDLPRVGGVFSENVGWTTAAGRCSGAQTGATQPVSVKVGTHYFRNYWHGNRINIPGRGSQAMLVATSATPKPVSGGLWTTSDLTSISCLPTIINGPGEGFIATTPDGTRYWFNWMAMAHEQELTEQRVSTLGFDHLPRRRVDLYATRVEDRFGNWVSYSYANGGSGPMRLSAIESSDGRRISVTHNASGFVQSVVADGRAWTYGYDSGTFGSLSSVTLPDGSAWALSLGTFQSLKIRYFQGDTGENWRSCTNPGDIDPKTYLGVVTHPSGAVGEFTLESRRFQRSGVYEYYPQNCSTGNVSDPNDDSEWFPSVWDSYSLVRKVVSGPGLTPATWAFSYFGGFATEVAAPGSIKWYTYGNTFRQDEGKLLRIEHANTAGDVLKTEEFTYALNQSGMPYPTPLGNSPQQRSDDFADEYPRPEIHRNVIQQGAIFSRAVAAFDAKMRPLAVTRYSTLGASISDESEYHDDPAQWVLGQVKRAVAAGVETSRTEFDGRNLPWKIYGFGQLQQTLTYYPDGTLATVKDGRDNSVVLSNWKRGIPQSIQYPATPEAPSGSTESAVVDDRGWILSVTDENGFSTGYEYDTMGRVRTITPPINDTTAWNPTTITFHQVAESEAGLSPGHWRQITTTGGYKKIAYFDAMSRPVMEQEEDVANPSGTLRWSAKRYDHDGRVVFASYPRNPYTSGWLNFDAPMLGVTTTYDALGRPVTVVADSELGPLTTKTEYLAGFQTKVIDPRGNATTTAYTANDEPTFDMPVLIRDSAGRETQIGRDAFGKPRELSRGAVGP